jgi:REP element-mobilizing transposase RayT
MRRQSVYMVYGNMMAYIQVIEQRNLGICMMCLPYHHLFYLMHYPNYQDNIKI